mmetsp:Transcript_9715/g.12310  ORF Transcript_9715/g.12310 Transcript_9715/m.12310 type:complete len:89 (+) Transcript_9715:1902-2168(+)
MNSCRVITSCLQAMSLPINIFLKIFLKGCCNAWTVDGRKSTDPQYLEPVPPYQYHNLRCTFNYLYFVSSIIISIWERLQQQQQQLATK